MKKLALILLAVIFLVTSLPSDARGFGRGLIIGGVAGYGISRLCCGPSYYYQPVPYYVAPPSIVVQQPFYSSTEERLARLTDLYSRGVISEQEYASSRSRILTGQ